MQTQTLSVAQAQQTLRNAQQAAQLKALQEVDIAGLLYAALEALFALQAAVDVQDPQHSTTVRNATVAVDSIAVLY